MDIQDHRRERLRVWISQLGGHSAAVRARRLSSSEASYLSQLVNGYSFGEKAARNWEVKLGLAPGWLDAKHGLQVEAPQVAYPSGTLQARPMSPAAFEDPPAISWEAILHNNTPLPATFTCEAPDDALAPGTPRGTPVVFVAAGIEPSPGIGVLVEDRGGNRYMRIYRPGLGGQWLAWARNENYPSLESGRDGLRILAVARNRMLDGAL